MNVLHLLSFITLVNYSDCARVLGIFPLPARSHYFLGSALMKEIANRGHDVTVINPFGEKDIPKNGKYRDILLTGFLERSKEMMETMPSFLDTSDVSPLFQLLMLNQVGGEIAVKTLEHPNVKELLKSDEKFDLVICEQFHVDALKGFAHHYGTPLILLSTVGANAWVNPLVGNPAPPAYVPELSLTYSSDMTFLQRVRNSIEYVLGELNRHLIFFPSQNRVLKKYFPNAPHLSELLYNASIVFLNSDSSINQPVPKVPSMIDIGGFHVKPPKALPKELKDILDNAKEGVIYFSMGSHLNSSRLPIEKKDALLKSFSKLKQTVLWKWESDDLPEKSSNVVTRKWLPQQDILAHPNIKLFITHGGLLSAIEAIYHGVPMLAIPIFGDQKMNAATNVKNGFALAIPYADVSEQSLDESINELLYNTKYLTMAKRRSQIMHDKPMKPLDTAIFWIEYVIRHKGATHLQVAALKLSWYQYLLLDVMIFMGIIALLVFGGMFYLLRAKFRKICKKCNNDPKKLKSKSS